MNELLNDVTESITDRVKHDCANTNLGYSERVLSVVSGGFIVGWSIKSIIKNPLSALTGISAGSLLLYRGITGHCELKKSADKLAGSEDIRIIEREYIVK